MDPVQETVAGTVRPLAGPPRSVLLLLNPHSRSGCDLAGPVAKRLEQAGIAVHPVVMAAPSQVSSDIVSRAADVQGVIVCGGDGSLNAVADGLISTGLPLGIIPSGTGNDLARTLSIPLEPMAAADLVIAGCTRRIDLGEVNGRPFFNVASVGLSADLAEGLTQQLKQRWGRLGYAIAALKVITGARPFHAWIHANDGISRVRTFQIAVGNGKHYGGGMTVADTAEIDDGTLDLYSLELSSVWKLAMMLPSFRTGVHGAWQEVRTERGGEFEIRTRRPRPVNADGEIVTTTPAHFRVRRAAVSVYVPQG
jgi:YegS/Rv2252/BmrU family lipid kinase